MVVKQHILENIKKLDRLYNSASTTEATYYSKLAIIELCGWIEFSMDNIATNFANRHLTSLDYQNSFVALIKSNYGFDYKSNFRKMLCQTIGMHNMQNLELPLIASGEIAILVANLNTLKQLRNDAAHNFIGTTTIYQAPSVTKAQLETIYPILKKIGASIRAL